MRLVILGVDVAALWAKLCAGAGRVWQKMLAAGDNVVAL